MLTITNFRKEYAGFLAISVDFLHFDQGIYWIKGANGSGKSTLFKAIAGLHPFEGEIVLNKVVSQKLLPVEYRKLVNYAEAEPVYPTYLTGNDLIAFVAEMKNAKPEQVTELINLLEIGSFIGNPTGSYSSGMLKKLSLLLAFLGNPQLIILDEPLITLDVKAAENIAHLIEKYNQTGVSFLVSSHQSKEMDLLSISARYLVENHTINII